MAEESKITAFLRKLHLVEYVDEGDEAEEMPGRQYARPQPRTGSSSVYESRYDNSRGIKRPVSRPAAKSASVKRGASSSAAIARREEKVPAVKPDTMVYYLGSIRECAEVIRNVIDGTSAVINLDAADEHTMQRIVDTLSGAAFALNAKVRKITENTYLIAPENVNVNMTGRVERRY